MISMSTRRASSPFMLLLMLALLVGNVSVGSAFFAVAPSPSPPSLLAGHRWNVLSPSSQRRVQANSLLRQPTAGGGLPGATERAAAAARRGGAEGNGIGSSSSGSCSSSSTGSDDDIDLDTAIANARANLAEGRSPGAGLESAFDQADAAFADLIVTSVDDQGVTLDDQDVEDLAKGGMMDDESKTKKSKGLFGDMSDVFGALSGGAHIVRREDGTL